MFKGWFERHPVFCNVVLLFGGVFLTVGLLYLAFFGLGEFVVWLGGLF